MERVYPFIRYLWNNWSLIYFSNLQWKRKLKEPSFFVEMEWNRLIFSEILIIDFRMGVRGRKEVRILLIGDRSVINLIQLQICKINDEDMKYWSRSNKFGNNVNFKLCNTTVIIRIFRNRLHAYFNIFLIFLTPCQFLFSTKAYALVSQNNLPSPSLSM